MAAALGVAGTARAADATLSPAHALVQWTGGPLAGAALDPADCSSSPNACDELIVNVDVAPSYWQTSPGGVVVRVEWTARDTELDLHVYDDKGAELAQSIYGGRTFQQVYLYQPPSGRYHVHVAGVVAAGVTYAGTAALTKVPVRQASLTPGTMRFSQSRVDPQILAREPAVRLDTRGQLLVAAPWGLTSAASMVWRSTDAGRTFGLLNNAVPGKFSAVQPRPCPTAVGGGDADVAADRTGRLYFVALSLAEVSVGYSTDHGATWHCSPLAAAVPEDDRPWLAVAPSADGSGPGVDTYLVHIDAALGQLPGGQETKPIRVHVESTSDGGATWSEQTAFGAGMVPFPGPVFVAADGTVYETFQAGNAAWFARSTDHGRSFTLRRVSARPGDAGNAWVSGAVDAAGNVYAAWVDSGSYETLYSYSTDRGDHWSAPARVSPSSQTTMLPWLAAGKGGDVAIAWYGANGRFIPDLAPGQTSWRVWVARTRAAASPSASFELSPLSETAVHAGPICTSCSGDHSHLGDFLQIAIAPDGSLVGAFNDNARREAVASMPFPYAMVARQTAGLGMSVGAVTTAAASSEPAGDARGPAGGPNIPQLDLTSLPTTTRAGSAVRLSFSLGSTTNLAGALAAANALKATDAYWLALWKVGDRVEYAGMHVTASGIPDFFGGDQPVGVEAPGGAANDKLRAELYASYPRTFTLKGQLDQVHRRVLVDLPLAQFHLAKGSVLHTLQAYSFTGLGADRTVASMLALVDGTPASAPAVP